MADIKTYAEFLTHIAAGGAHNLYANTDIGSDGKYIINNTVTVGTNLVVTAIEPVTIERGAASLIHRAITAQWLGAAGKVITFSGNLGQGLHAMYVRALNAGVGAHSSYRFDFCDFIGSTGNNGFSMLPDNTYTIDVVLNHCQSYGNANDGFSILLLAHDANTSLEMTACRAFNNGTGSADQAFTTHANSGAGTDTIVINGGSFIGGQGIYLSGKFNATITDAYVRGINANGYGISITDEATGSLTLENTRLRGIAGDFRNLSFASITTLFKDTPSSGGVGIPTLYGSGGMYG